MLPKAFLGIYSFKYNPIKQSPNHFLSGPTPALPDPVMLPNAISHPIPSSFHPSVSAEPVPSSLSLFLLSYTVSLHFIEISAT